MYKSKILVVEDDDNWKKIFKLLIEEKTTDLFEYSYVDSLAATLEAVKGNNYDLIILDLMLPDSHANNTIRTMSDEVKYIPIVIISTLDDEKLMQTAFLYGIEDYLVKDNYSVEVFRHVCTQAIKRFIGKSLSRVTHDILENLEKTLANLKSTEEQLD